MLRKIFGTAMVVSLVGAAMLGVVYAWSASDHTGAQGTVGVASFTVSYIPNANVIGPNGANVIVGHGDITVGPAFALQNTGGSVTIDSLSSVGPGGSTCTTGNFSGLVVNVDGSFVAPNATGGGFDVSIETTGGAPADCQADILDYTVTVNAST